MNIYKTEGIYFDGDICEWQASITVDGKEIDLGSYPDVFDAFEARKIAESEQEPDPVKADAILKNMLLYYQELIEDDLRKADALTRALEQRRAK